MKRLWLLLVLALASFAAIQTAFTQTAPAPVAFSVDALKSGLAWQDGNQTAAFVVLNASGPAYVQGFALQKPVPESVFIWAQSDQHGFAVFLGALEAHLSSFGISPEKAFRPDDLNGPPAVLILASGAVPAELLSTGKLASLLERGWVVAHVGLPFSFMAKDGRLAQNPFWRNQSAAWGFDFSGHDPLLGYTVAAGNASVFRAGPWQIVSANGSLAFFDRTLDTGFASPADAASLVADLVLNVSWQVPLSRLSANVSGVSTLYFPPARQNPSALLFLVRQENVSRRIQVFLRAPSARVLAPLSAWAGQAATVSLFSNASAPADVDVTLEKDGVTLWRRNLGRIPVGVAFASLSVNTSLENGDYLLSFASPQKTLGHARLRIVAPFVRIRFADFSSKTVYADARVGQSPYAFAFVDFNGTRLATDGQGSFRFKDPTLSGGPRAYFFTVSGVPVFARYDVPSGFLSSLMDRALAGGALAVFGFAFLMRRRHRPRVRVTAPSRPHTISLVFNAQRLCAALSRHAEHVGRAGVPLNLLEATDALERDVGDPQCRIRAEQAGLFLRAAHENGAVVLEEGLVAPRAWFAKPADASRAFFLRRFYDACIQSGFHIRKTGSAYRLSRGKKRWDVAVDADRQRIRFGEDKKRVDLEEFRARLAG